MKRALIIAAGLGLALAVAIVGYEGFGAVTQAFAAVGYGLAVVTVIRAAELAGAGLGWWLIFPSEERPVLPLCVRVRFIREAINSLLPVAQVGGDIAGARLITLSGVPAAMSGATVLVDILMQVVSLFLFTLLGIALFALDGADNELLQPIMIGAGLMGLALAGFFLAQRFGGAKLLDRALMALADRFGWSALANLASLHDNLVRIYADVPRLALAMLVHIVVWFIGTLEILVALRLMGFPVSLAEAVVIESLGQAVRAAAFLVPGALGVQEAGFVAICSAFGIPAAPAVALSLVKRVPELVLGPPFLFVWHAHEAKALKERQGANS
ncbi:MAG TPA: lysylphosphatidylglycerol synthase domain-containing protein [Pseudolabrys sp.]|nr:lysylphosphatidylglycerol synthase domain-containing protein [Pseudolabrys sp.]